MLEGQDRVRVLDVVVRDDLVRGGVDALAIVWLVREDGDVLVDEDL